MKTKFLSFVFPETTKKQIDAMPAEMKLRFYVFVTDYGMYDKEPEDLTEIEKLIWIPMKDLIDSCKSARGGAPEGNQNAKKTTETTLFLKKQPKQPLVMIMGMVMGRLRKMITHNHKAKKNQQKMCVCLPTFQTQIKK